MPPMQALPQYLDAAVQSGHILRRSFRSEYMTDHYVRPDVAAFLQFLNNAPGPKLYELSAPDARMVQNAMRDVADAPVGELAVMRDLEIPGPAGTVPARLYDRRADRGAGPVLVFFHGGGFVIGNLYTYDPYCAEVARLLDLPVISVDYRLGPEFPFPAAFEDCEAAARWLASSPDALGLDVTGLVLSGDSAGGNLTISTSIALRDDPADVPVLVQHPIYPIVTLNPDWPSMRDYADGYLLTAELMQWFGDGHGATGQDYRTHPLDLDQSGMPPTVLTTASLDPLCDQGLAYGKKLKASGVRTEHIIAEGTIHGHINVRKGIPSSQQDVETYVSALKSMLAEVMADA
jgi:acetyl esterase